MTAPISVAVAAAIVGARYADRIGETLVKGLLHANQAMAVIVGIAQRLRGEVQGGVLAEATAGTGDQCDFAVHGSSSMAVTVDGAQFIYPP